PLAIFVYGGLVRCAERDIDAYSSHENLLVDDRRGRSSRHVRAAQKGASFAVTPLRRASHLLNRAPNSYGGRPRKRVKGRSRGTPLGSLTAVLRAGRETVAAPIAARKFSAREHRSKPSVGITTDIPAQLTPDNGRGRAGSRQTASAWRAFPRAATS